MIEYFGANSSNMKNSDSLTYLNTKRLSADLKKPAPDLPPDESQE
jgi:hypothetical protein